MSYASQQQGLTGPKLVSLIIALSIVGLVGTGMVLFLTVDAVKEMVERVTTVDVTEPPPPPPPDEPPPPDQPDTSPPPPNAPAQLIEIPRESPIQTTQQETPKEVYREPARIVEAPPGPPSPPPRGPSKARGVQPKNQRSWSARIQEDYPRRAAQEEIEGTVGVRCTVTTEGKATGCSVTSSSGSDILDAAATKAVERYARFEPALNDDGVPINASWSTRITYKLN
ncbi:MAG: energy transducer TonB [Erythrobacter sp.]